MKFRTDIKPMGALSVTKDKLEMAYKSPDYWAEPKMDGSRYVAQVIGGKVLLTSRRESVKGGMVDKTANVPHIIAELSKLPDCILDGEIDNRYERNFHRVQGIMGSSPERARELQATDPLVYKVFDCISITGISIAETPLSYRVKPISYLLKGCKYLIETERIFGEENKRKAFSEAIAAGQEGIILKNAFAPYIEGKKPSNCWIKVKLTQTYEGVVVGYKEGEGKYRGMLGTLTIAQMKDGKMVEVAEISGMTDEERVIFQKRVDSGDTGWVVEFKAQEVDGCGRYRHPRFSRLRLDKAPRDCKYGEA